GGARGVGPTSPEVAGAAAAAAATAAAAAIPAAEALTEASQKWGQIGTGTASAVGAPPGGRGAPTPTTTTTTANANPGPAAGAAAATAATGRGGRWTPPPFSGSEQPPPQGLEELLSPPESVSTDRERELELLELEAAAFTEGREEGAAVADA
ncbi:unnamed protein product, partial [Laminaria digitata]